MADASTWIQVLVLGGLAGAVGQVARTAVGLKKVNDVAVAEDVNPQHLIIASRLFISLTIGFVAGALVALAMGIDPANIATEEILGLAAAGYAGTDAIEGMIGRITPTRPEETGKAETRETAAEHKPTAPDPAPPAPAPDEYQG
ncbi:hypothetical protein [Bauldia litoralis]|uniref:Holin n=1 Tax=Bauldia litoralis TaxID=665467 RepID=A0A1G6B7J0_9HYPH|nr:hypothetical protein [Bauldia litoralis]SDB16581.1 hypothetical protein SAMN02982931_01318 [Bauldia litoralis]